MNQTLPVIRVVQADITTLAVDAIVNAANSSLLGGGKGESERLASCYKHSLELAEKNGVTTIAFPSISTGIYGYPIESAATIAINTVNAYLKQGSSLKEIIFCCFSEEDCQVYKKVLNEFE